LVQRARRYLCYWVNNFILHMKSSKLIVALSLSLLGPLAANRKRAVLDESAAASGQAGYARLEHEIETLREEKFNLGQTVSSLQQTISSLQQTASSQQQELTNMKQIVSSLTKKVDDSLLEKFRWGSLQGQIERVLNAGVCELQRDYAGCSHGYADFGQQNHARLCCRRSLQEPVPVPPAPWDEPDPEQAPPELVFQLLGEQVFDGRRAESFGGDVADIPLGNSPYTIEMFVKPKANIGMGGMISWGDCSPRQANAFRFNHGPTGMTHYWWGDDMTAAIPYSLADDNFHHVAVTYDGITRKMFVDYVEIGEDIPDYDHKVTRKDNFLIGKSHPCDGSKVEYFKGSIKDVQIWDHALKTTEMKQA